MTSLIPKSPRGRCIAHENGTLTVENQFGISSVVLKKPYVGSLGDIVEISDGIARVLTPNRLGNWPLNHHVLDPRRQKGVRMRQKVEAAIREFFASKDFIETRTPLLVPCPGMEPHIRPFRATPHAQGGTSAFLPTSPEFAMKRLLAGGLERIFQICPAFRDEPASVTHQPEFTMLEWYRAYAGYEDIMRDTEELFEFAAKKIFGKPEIRFGEKTISVSAPWPRLRVRDLFEEHVGIDLAANPNLARECARLGLDVKTGEDWDDLYFKIWLNLIEPKLPPGRAVFVTRYPASQAALSVIDSDPDGSRWARRFEAYAGGLELANAFEELTDPIEQRRRFEKDMKLRAALYGPDFPPSPIDEGFLSALAEGMPPSGGIALGVDRMVMLFADENDIRYTSWLCGDLFSKNVSP